MAGSMEHPFLHVEGINDKFTIIYLLQKNGIDYDLKPRPLAYPEFIEQKSVQQLLAGMEVAIEESRLRTIGFVLDADAPLSQRWNHVRECLRNAQVEDVPDSPPPDGFIGWTPRYQTRVGVWLMPDNEQDGKIENFLRMLIDEQDSLISHAQLATNTARGIGALFSDADEIKAVIHTWLAWQKHPGHPFGRAMQEHYFRHDRPIAGKFVAWFRQLYNIPPTSA